jgi:hypothetical protein
MPVSVSPLAVTVFPTPTSGVANTAVGAAQSTSSLPTTPLSVHSVTVALTVPSYALFAAVTAGVRLAFVIAAVVVAVVVASA